MSASPLGMGDLLTAASGHLRDYRLPEPCSIELLRWSPSAGGALVRVQLEDGGLPSLAAGLLAWAATLPAVVARAWRVPDGAGVHLSVHSALQGGVLLEVYGGYPFDADGLGGDLEPGGSVDAVSSRPVSLEELRRAAAGGVL